MKTSQTVLRGLSLTAAFTSLTFGLCAHAQQQPARPAQAAQAEGLLGSALSKFFAIAENYPQLKANQNFLALQEELSSTENRIGFARQFYNDQVTEYNTRIQTVPSNLVAGMFGFQTMELFQIGSEAERAVPKVQF